MYSTKYNYSNMANSAHKYDLAQRDEVNGFPYAIYTKATVPSDRGNPFIEALPLQRDDDAITYAYKRPLDAYDYDKEVHRSKQEQYESLTMLKNLRFILPMSYKIEDMLHENLIKSYRERHINYASQYTTPGSVNSVEIGHHTSTKGNNEGTIDGMALIGHSGCGKTSTMATALKNYPQVIEHKMNVRPGEAFIMYQVVYLHVECEPNSNFSALWTGVGAALDDALGNIDNYYETLVKKGRSVAEKGAIVKTLIEKFSIGVIVFDEIQHIDFTMNKESSFDAILTLQNKTKVSVAVIGTFDSYKKMFPTLRGSRRVGRMIRADDYCESREYFNAMVSWLMEYQWFKPRVTDKNTQLEIADALYEETGGLIDLLISIWSLMNYRFIHAEPDPKKAIKGPVQPPKFNVDKHFVSTTARMYIPQMKAHLSEMKEDELEEKRQEQYISETNHLIETELDKLKSTESLSKSLAAMNSANDKAYMKLEDDIAKGVKVFHPNFTEAEVRKTIHQLYSDKNNRSLTETELADKVVAALMQMHAMEPKEIKKSGTAKDPNKYLAEERQLECSVAATGETK